jgi:hypothetical protein
MASGARITSHTPGPTPAPTEAEVADAELSLP